MKFHTIFISSLLCLLPFLAWGQIRNNDCRAALELYQTEERIAKEAKQAMEQADRDLNHPLKFYTRRDNEESKKTNKQIYENLQLKLQQDLATIGIYCETELKEYLEQIKRTLQKALEAKDQVQ